MRVGHNERGKECPSAGSVRPSRLPPSFVTRIVRSLSCPPSAGKRGMTSRSFWVLIPAVANTIYKNRRGMARFGRKRNLARNEKLRKSDLSRRPFVVPVSILDSLTPAVLELNVLVIRPIITDH
jgi:hypothetical protein